MPTWWECGGGGRWTGETRGQGMTVVECIEDSRHGEEGTRRKTPSPPPPPPLSSLLGAGTWSLRQRRSYGARVRTGMSYVILRDDSLTGVALLHQNRCARYNWKIFQTFFNFFQTLRSYGRDKIQNAISREGHAKTEEKGKIKAFETMQRLMKRAIVSTIIARSFRYRCNFSYAVETFVLNLIHFAYYKRPT